MSVKVKVGRPITVTMDGVEHAIKPDETGFASLVDGRLARLVAERVKEREIDDEKRAKRKAEQQEIARAAAAKAELEAAEQANRSPISKIFGSIGKKKS